MTLFHKRLIYLTFFAVFFVVVPVILMYASGYRYNFKKLVVQRTGAINVESQPEDAQVRVDGVLHKELTPAQIRNLLPREYSVVVSKEGYLDWQRQLEVRANITTFLQKIELFKTPQLPEFINTLPANFPLSSTSTIGTVNSRNVSLKADEEQYVLTSHSFFTDATTTLTTLPISEYEFHDSIGDWLVIKDNLNEILYLFKINNEEIIDRQLISPVKGYDWNTSVNKLLFYNDFELWTMDLDAGYKSLITRLGKGIQSAVWHPRGNYAVYLTNNEIKIVELVYLQQRQNLNYTALPTTTNVLISETGDTLYLNGELGNQKGWFELEIQ